MGLKRPAGALVSQRRRQTVRRPAPASSAGDLIVSVDGQDVDDPNAFDYRFGTKPIGGSARLGILRGRARADDDGRRCAARLRLRVRRS